jgi:hypothetical protein
LREAIIQIDVGRLTTIGDGKVLPEKLATLAGRC